MMRWLLALSILFAPAAAVAYCPPETDYSVKAEFARSRYVVIAEADSETWLDDEGRPTALEYPLLGGAAPLGLDPYSGAVYALQVVRPVKGEPPAELSLFSENSTARFPLLLGETYLLFLQEDESGRLFADNCGNSGIVALRRKQLEELPGPLGGISSVP